MAITLNGTTGITTPDVTSDSYTGAFAVDASAPDNSLVVNSSGNVGIGKTPVNKPLEIYSASDTALRLQNSTTGTGATDGFLLEAGGSDVLLVNYENGNMLFYTDNTERARIDSSGNLLVGTTDAEPWNNTGNNPGVAFRPEGVIAAARYQEQLLFLNRTGNDGQLAEFLQDGVAEGSISVSGTTVSYNGGHLARWSQLADNTKDETILKGTVMTNLDQMAEWTTDGVTEDNEQLNCMAVSSVEGDPNVAGVFVNWDNDDDVYTNDMNIAMTGDMIIRIAQGVTVQRGDLLMSAGDGTAKPQGDDIVRSKTIAKVTSTNVTCTYADGSFCVPCVLMAC